MGIDVFFYMRAWNKNNKEIAIQDYVSFTGEDNSVYSVHNRYVGVGLSHNHDYSYNKITKAELNDQIRNDISYKDPFGPQKTDYERLFLLDEGECLYEMNVNEVIKEKWLLKHVDGYISRDEYYYECYDEDGLVDNSITNWYLENEIDPSDDYYIKVEFDVVDQIATQRAEFINEYFRIIRILKERADLDEDSIRLYLYYNF